MAGRRGGAPGDGGEALRQYLDEIGAYPLLTQADEVELAAEIAAGHEAADQLATFGPADDSERKTLERLVERGEKARERFINANLRLVVSVARRYQGHGLAMPDLVQEGNVGLMRAVEKFDASRGFKFSTYATWWIRQAMGRAIAETSRSIRLPAHVRESAPLVMRAMDELSIEHDHHPTPAEVAAQTGLTTERVELVLIHKADVVSLSRKVHDDSDDTLGDGLEDPTLDTPYDLATATLDREALLQSMTSLNEREREVIRRRFGLGHHREQTLAEIGEQFDLTRERIRQIEAKALSKLRHPCIAGMRQVRSSRS